MCSDLYIQEVAKLPESFWLLNKCFYIKKKLDVISLKEKNEKEAKRDIIIISKYLKEPSHDKMANNDI